MKADFSGNMVKENILDEGHSFLRMPQKHVPLRLQPHDPVTDKTDPQPVTASRAGIGPAGMAEYRQTGYRAVMREGNVKMWRYTG